MAAVLHIGPGGIAANANSNATYDNIRVVSDSMSNTTTMAYNAANEMTSLTDGNGAQSLAYDQWGRQTSRTRGSSSATYTYNYGDKLTKVVSSFADEGTVTYKYGGDGKRRERDVSGGAVTAYNFDRGNNVVSESKLCVRIITSVPFMVIQHCWFKKVKLPKRGSV